MITLSGSCSQKQSTFGIDADTLSRHMLFMGGTGCGKTDLMFQFVRQIRRRMTALDVMIIFDSKGDYYQQFGKPEDLVIGNSAQYRGQSQKWNIFRELTADGLELDACSINALEISRSLFSSRIKNTTNSFFPSAAQDIFASLMISVCHDAASDTSLYDKLMNNFDFIRFLQTSTPTMLKDQLEAYEQLSAAGAYITGDTEQSQGVISEMYSVIRDIFIGVFAQNGKFSMREFVRNKGRRVLFLEYDPAIGRVFTPVYRLLIDMALKESLGQNNPKGNVYLFLDEFKLVPHMQHIDDAVNFGRSKGLKVFAGIQSIEQLYDIYGQSRGRNVAAGFSSIFSFRANDSATMRYVEELYGSNLVSMRYVGADGKLVDHVQPGKVIEDWTLCALDVGQAVVSMPKAKPFLFLFDKFREEAP